MHLIERISLHLAGMAPHIKERLTARLLAEALDEIKRLQSTPDDPQLTLADAEQAFAALPHLDATLSVCAGCVRAHVGEPIMLARRSDLEHLLALLPPF